MDIRKLFIKILIIAAILTPSISFSAPLFNPGQTLNPGCLPSNPDCTVSTTTYDYIYPSFTYASSTYYPYNSNPLSYLTGFTELDPFWMSASSSYLTTTNAGSEYVTFGYASTTYYRQTNPGNYITSAALAPYLTSATAASNYLTIVDAGNTYQPIGSYLTSYTETDPIWSAVSTNYLTNANAQITYPSFVYASSAYVLPSALNSYLTNASAQTNYISTSTASSTFAQLSGATFSGSITAGNLSGTNSGDVTLTDSTNGLTVAGQVLTLTLSGTSATGTLSATDWNIFNNKQNALGFTPENATNKATNFSVVNDTLYPTVQAAKTYADSLVVGLLDYRGGYDASGNTYPATGGSGDVGTVKKGDTWVISIPGSLNGAAVQAGDSIIANVDSPDQTPSNWNTLNSNISYAPEDQANKATNLNTVNDTLYPTVQAVVDALAEKQASGTYVTVETDPIYTANTYATNMNQNVNSSSSPIFQGLTISNLGGILIAQAGVISTTTNNITNWDTAYSWGNHAGLYLDIGATASNSSLFEGHSASYFQVAGNYLVAADITGKEDTSNKVTTISGASTDTQYPSAKLLFDQLALKQNSGSYLTTVDISANTNLLADAPLLLSNDTLSITQSSSTGNGYLSSTDWNTFNNKVSSSYASNTFPSFDYASGTYYKSGDVATFAEVTIPASGLITLKTDAIIGWTDSGDSTVDTYLYRSGVNSLKTMGHFDVGRGITINDNGGNFDSSIEGDTDQNLFFADASTDRIGIGTVSPLSKVHIQSASPLRFDNGSSTDGYYFAQAAPNIWGLFGTSAGQEFQFINSKLNVDSGLTVGSTNYGGTTNIYTRDEISGAALRVLYSGTYYNDITEKGMHVIGNDMTLDASSSGKKISMQIQGSEVEQINATGTITTGLTINNSVTSGTSASANIIAGTGGYSNLYFGDTASSTIGRIGINHANDFMYFDVGGATGMWLSGNGNLHFNYGGALGPYLFAGSAVQLNVNGSLSASGNLSVGSASGNNNIKILSSGGESSLEFQTGAGSTWINSGAGGINDMYFKTGSTERMRITAGGNVGIGTTTPEYKLDVFGSNIGIRTTDTGGGATVAVISNPASQSWLLLGDTDANGIGRIAYDNASDKMSLWTNYGERVSIDSNGNVGIGTTTPDRTLSVIGGMKVTAAVGNIIGTSTDIPGWDSYPLLVYGSGLRLYNLGAPTEIDLTYGGVGQSAITQTGSTLQITNATSTRVPLTVKGQTDQSVNLQNWTNSSDTVVASVSSTGTISGTGFIVNGINALNPSGSIIMYGSSSTPAGWLLCDGASYIRTGIYANLFAAIGTSFGAVDSSHFNVPDMRDAFPRGTGTSTIFTDNTKGTRSMSITGGATSGIGSKQEDSFQGHNTTINDPGHSHTTFFMLSSQGGGSHAINMSSNNGESGSVNQGSNAVGTGITATTPINNGVNGDPRTSFETRPKNIELNFIIKL